jgi:hypothetical protein
MIPPLTSSRRMSVDRKVYTTKEKNTMNTGAKTAEEGRTV